MDISRLLVSKGCAHGTVIASDFQEAGRGRTSGRTWQTENKMSLPFTIALRYPKTENIPSALTLRAGLALSLAIEDFSGALKGLVKIKWPNDIMINSKKAAGILCESDGENVFIGIGINIRQKEFPFNLREKAVSIALASGTDVSENERFILLEKTLSCLYGELMLKKNIQTWKARLEERLYKKGERIIFKEGAADSGKTVKGVLHGIGEGGELLIAPDGEDRVTPFITGEISFS